MAAGWPDAALKALSGLVLLRSVVSEQGMNAVKWSVYKALLFKNHSSPAWQVITATLRAETSMQLSVSEHQSTII